MAIIDLYRPTNLEEANPYPWENMDANGFALLSAFYSTDMNVGLAFGGYEGPWRI